MATIYAYEGPSGSGKGYHLNLAEAQGYNYLPRPTYPRNQGPHLGSFSSSSYEYTCIAYATMMEQDVWADRFLLSRFVYRAFEEGKLDPQAARVRIHNSWANMRELAQAEAMTRLGHSMMPISAHIYLLMPTVGRLQHQRHHSGREYPFDLIQESRYYRDIYRAIEADPIWGVEIEPVYLA